MLIGKCKYCEKLFIKKNINHAFCSRKCFFKNYLLKRKANPEFICPECNNRISLDFNPKKDKLKWHNFICPNCGYNHINNETDDYQENEYLKTEFRIEKRIIKMIEIDLALKCPETNFNDENDINHEKDIKSSK